MHPVVLFALKYLLDTLLKGAMGNDLKIGRSERGRSGTGSATTVTPSVQDEVMADIDSRASDLVEGDERWVIQFNAEEAKNGVYSLRQHGKKKLETHRSEYDTPTNGRLRMLLSASFPLHCSKGKAVDARHDKATGTRNCTSKK